MILSGYANVYHNKVLISYVSLPLRSRTAWSRVMTLASMTEGCVPWCNVTSPTGGQQGSPISSFSISLYLFLGFCFLRIAFPQRFKAELGTTKVCKNKESNICDFSSILRLFCGKKYIWKILVTKLHRVHLSRKKSWLLLHNTLFWICITPLRNDHIWNVNNVELCTNFNFSTFDNYIQS